MQLAKLPGGERVEAEPGATATCPCCDAIVIPKCGQVVSWHWAHKGADCDSWAEGESAWHSSWKAEWPSECREVVIGPHRADVCVAHRVVIELQHSHLSVEEIAEREAFYKSAVGKVVWLWDVREPFESGRLKIKPRADYYTFRWSHARRTIAACTGPVYWDLGNGRVFFAAKMHNHERDDAGRVAWGTKFEPFAGWGHVLTREDVLRRYQATSQVRETNPNLSGGLFDGC